MLTAPAEETHGSKGEDGEKKTGGVTWKEERKLLDMKVAAKEKETKDAEEGVNDEEEATTSRPWALGRDLGLPMVKGGIVTTREYCGLPFATNTRPGAASTTPGRPLQYRERWVG